MRIVGGFAQQGRVLCVGGGDDLDPVFAAMFDFALCVCERFLLEDRPREFRSESGFSMSSSAEAEKTASAEPNTSSRWTAPFGPIPGVRVRAMSGISRFIFRIRQSPNEFGSASFGRNRRFRIRFGASVSGCKDRFLPIKMQSCPEVLQKREIFVYLQTRSRESGSDGRVARQRSAKPCTAVRIRFRPHRNRVADSCNAVFVWYKYNMYFFEEWLPVVFD